MRVINFFIPDLESKLCCSEAKTTKIKWAPIKLPFTKPFEKKYVLTLLVLCFVIFLSIYLTQKAKSCVTEDPDVVTYLDSKSDTCRSLKLEFGSENTTSFSDAYQNCQMMVLNFSKTCYF